jgi:YggT family protein
VDIICLLGNLYFIALFARIILSWFPISPESPFATIFSFLYTITEPVLGPIRRMLPPIGMGGMGLDLSPIIVFFGLRIVMSALGCGGI